MVARKQTSIKVDPIAWESAKAVFKEYNLTLSDAINIFLNKVRLEQGMPFDIKVPSKQLDMAMKESKNNEGSFHDTLDDLIDDLKR
ncbi:MAG: type II toxin-antitoxin system RelB/DinJ family antitoxin [Sulfuricurvum sp.]